MLSLFVEANAMEIILEEDDQVKLKYLTAAMAFDDNWQANLRDLAPSL